MNCHNTNRNILYRIFAPDGALLYVGATTNPGVRLAAHSAAQPWWDEASDITIERFDTLDELNAAELAAIQTEGSRYNVMHAEPFRWNDKPRRSRGEGALFQRQDGYWVGGVELPSVDGCRRWKRVVRKSRDDAANELPRLRLEADVLWAEYRAAFKAKMEARKAQLLAANPPTDS